MKTAQLHQDTGLVFARVSPLVTTDPPPGVTFVDYDETEGEIPLGLVYEPRPGHAIRKGPVHA